ncbi:MAG: DUF4249 domain-containing protein [Saprospiraceae bacterium]|nr:DUF4249 domain-containing protein [Saprospiraceae bacterium]
MITNITILYKRRLFQVLALLGLSVGLWNCQDTIDVALDDAPQLLVVDAWLNNLPEAQTIRLSLTQPYFDNKLSDGINDATVTIVDDQGNMTTFQGQGDGNYTWNPTGEEGLGEVGRIYTLNIDWDGKTYTGTAPMTGAPPIDSITQEFRVDDIRGPDGIYCQFFARDLVGLGDAYWIKTYKNGQFLNKPQEINLAFDAAFAPGAEADALIFIPPIREGVNRFPDPDTDDNDEVAPWNPGDSIRVEIHSITPTAFQFLTIARDQMTNGDNTIFAIPLANTKGNMKSSQADEDVLGMFNMAAVARLGDRIEEQ